MIVDLTELTFAWKAGAEPVLDIASFGLDAGERVFLWGPSGSGKSTLLGLLAGVIAPQQGEIRVLGYRLGAMSGAARDRFRADHVGVVFQLFNLVPYLSVIENVTLPCRFSVRRRQRALRQAQRIEDEARRLLAALELTDTDLLGRPVTELSVGQQQRVAAARALIGAPELVVADEPTSALDQHLKERFVDLLREECTTAGSTLLFVSHDRSLLPLFDRAIDFVSLNRACEPRKSKSHSAERVA
ncbi:MAG: ABC transporter ATP-binding protein [Rhodospirillales bacterium]|nr:MAG: ABC transporter ATP-binding protein [Rhodospirillales bacterium]